MVDRSIPRSRQQAPKRGRSYDAELRRLLKQENIDPEMLSKAARDPKDSLSLDEQLQVSTLLANLVEVNRKGIITTLIGQRVASWTRIKGKVVINSEVPEFDPVVVDLQKNGVRERNVAPVSPEFRKLALEAGEDTPASFTVRYMSLNEARIGSISQALKEIGFFMVDVQEV